MKLPQHVSESVKRLNPDLFVGGLVTALNESKPRRALVENSPARAQGKARVAYRVVLTAHRRRLLDEHDNLRHGMKPLVDAIAMTLGLDDADKRISWEYGQVKTSGKQGVCVMIFPA